MSPEQIKSLRTRLRWSQSELAKRLDVSVDTVRSWEGKKAVPPSAFNLANLRNLEVETRQLQEAAVA